MIRCQASSHRRLFSRLRKKAEFAAAIESTSASNLPPHGQDMLRDFVGRYKQAHPDADVQFLDMGSREVPRLDRPNSTTGCLNVTKTGPTAS